MDDEPAKASSDAAEADGLTANESAGASAVAHSGAEPADAKQARDLEFTLFYNEQMPRLVVFLIVHGARSSFAADVAQDTMVEAYRKWEQIDHPRAWIRTVASRLWWRRVQRLQDESPCEDLANHPLVAPAMEFDEIANRHAFLRLLAELPTAQRQVMAWTYDGFQPVEIATLLHKPAATVRSLLRDARAALRRKYDSGEEKP